MNKYQKMETGGVLPKLYRRVAQSPERGTVR